MLDVSQILLWAGSLLGGAAVLALLLVLAGRVYQLVASARDRRRYPAPGRLVQVGAHRFHLRDAGQGGPTVVFDAMMGESMLGFLDVADRVSRFTRTVAWDRAGYGWSDWTGTPRTSEQIAGELHALLRAAGIPGPYVLVGHVFGAMNARLFAHLHPGETAGLVLIDPLHEDKPLRMPEQHEEYDRRLISLADKLRKAAPFGLLRLAAALGLVPQLEKRFQRLPEGLRGAARGVFLRSSYWEVLYREFTEWKQSAGQLRATGSLGDLPLVVITPGRWDAESFPPGFPVEETRRIWTELHLDLVRRSTRGRHVTAERSDDMIQLDQPELLAEEIRKVVEEACETGSRLRWSTC